MARSTRLPVIPERGRLMKSLLESHTRRGPVLLQLHLGAAVRAQVNLAATHRAIAEFATMSGAGVGGGARGVARRWRSRSTTNSTQGCETEGPVTSGPVATAIWASSPPSYLTAYRPTRLSSELEEVVAGWPIGLTR